MKLLYCAQFYSHLSYGISIWGCMIKKEQLNKIDRLHKKAVSLISLNSNVNTIMKEEKLLTIEEIINLELLKIGHRLSLCKVICVEHAYNHIQVRPVYNKQR